MSCNVKVFFLSSKDFVSLDGFLGDISDDEVRHRKSSSHRVPSNRRKPEKVSNSEFYQHNLYLWQFCLVFDKTVQHFQQGLTASSGTLR